VTQEAENSPTRAILFSRLEWRRRLVFWGGAILVGTISVLFADAANWAQAMFQTARHHAWLLPLLITPAGFVACAWAGRVVFPGSQGSGIPQAIAARNLDSEEARQSLLNLKICAGKIALTILGLLCGASVGREGPTVQVGAGIMRQAARLGGMGDERGLILAGSAAGIAAAFNAPLAGIVFAIEEMSRSFEARTNGLVLYAVIIAGLVSLGLVGHYTYFGETSVVLNSQYGWAMVFVAGITGGLAGGAFSRLMLEGARLAKRWLSTQSGARKLLLPLGCGLVAALLGLCTHGATFGTGYAEARAAVQGQPIAFYFWPAKLLATLAAAVSGMPGGIFAPSLAVGAGLGDWLVDAAGPTASLGAVLGMAGYFSGVVQAPMTAFVIILEMTGNDDNVIPLMLAAMLGYAASRLVAPEALYHGLAKEFE